MEESIRSVEITAQRFGTVFVVENIAIRWMKIWLLSVAYHYENIASKVHCTLYSVRFSQNMQNKRKVFPLVSIWCIVHVKVIDLD